MHHTLVEIVFSGIAPHFAWRFLQCVPDLIGRVTSTFAPHLRDSVPLSLFCSFDSFQVFWNDPDASFSIGFSRIAIPGGELVNPTLWFRGDGETDFLVEILFDVSGLISFETDERTALHAFAAQVASDLCAAQYYAGLEPADDPSTRLFTDRTTGPFDWSDIKVI